MAECYDGWSATFCSFTPSALGRRLTKKNKLHSCPAMTRLFLLHLLIAAATTATAATAAAASAPGASVMILRWEWGRKQRRAERMKWAVCSAAAAEGSAAVGSPSQFFQKSVYSHDTLPWIYCVFSMLQSGNNVAAQIHWPGTRRT